MISDSDLINFPPKNRNAQILMDNQTKNELFNSEFHEPNRIRQSSSLRQMTWVPSTSQSSNAWNSNESTFLTNVNSISSLDPVVQSYVDQQITAEFSKLIKPFSESINKLKELFEKHIIEHQDFLNNISSAKNNFQDKFISLESKMQQIESLNSENEKNKKEITDTNNSIITLEEILKSFEEKLINLESNQSKIVSKNKENDLIKELQNQILSMNDSTTICLSRLQNQIDDHSNDIKTIEKKNSDEIILLHKENDEKFQEYQKAALNLKNDFDKKIIEINLNVERYIQQFNNYEKHFDKFVLKECFNELQQKNKVKFEQNEIEHNQLKKEIRNELSQFKEKIEKCEKSNFKQNEPIQNQNNQKIFDENTKKIQNLETKIQEINLKVLNLESAFESMNLLSTTVSLIQERVANINKDEIFFESQIKNIENEIEKIKLKISKFDRLSLVTFQSTVDIIGNETKGQFDLTIGEPDLNIGESGIHLFLPKSYQDYSFHYGQCAIFEPVLKEPVVPKSTRRKPKSRKLKK